MRDIRKSVLSTPGHCLVGPKVRAVLEQYLDTKPKVQQRCLAALGNHDIKQEQVISTNDLLQLRTNVLEVFKTLGVHSNPSAIHLSVCGDTSTCITGGLLHA